MMTINVARFIEPHPVPVFETHHPQFHIYPNVEQNIPRPTWKGSTRGLGGWSDLVPFVDRVMPTGDRVGGLGPQTESITAYNMGARAGFERGGLIVGVVGLALGIGLGYWLGKGK